MKKNDFKFSSNMEVKNREDFLLGFIEKIIAGDEHPYFISDDTTIFDITTESESNLLDLIEKEYQVRLSLEQLKLKLWQLVDLLRSGDK